MRLPITPATTLQRELRAQLRHNSPAGRVIVAVDGWDSNSTRAFADAFAAIIAEDGAAVVRASVGDFLRPRAERRAEPAASDIDAETLRRVLLDPFREGGQTAGTTGFQLAAWDAARDAMVQARWVTADADAVLLIDGPFVQRADLRSAFSFTVWLEGSEAELAARAGRSSAQPLSRAEVSYQREAHPVREATVLVNISDPAAPVEFYRDFC